MEPHQSRTPRMLASIPPTWCDRSSPSHNKRDQSTKLKNHIVLPSKITIPNLPTKKSSNRSSPKESLWSENKTGTLKKRSSSASRLPSSCQRPFFRVMENTNGRCQRPDSPMDCTPSDAPTTNQNIINTQQFSSDVLSSRNMRRSASFSALANVGNSFDEAARLRSSVLKLNDTGRTRSPSGDYDNLKKSPSIDKRSSLDSGTLLASTSKLPLPSQKFRSNPVCLVEKVS